jgi:threonyl-tRNA synthetase
MQPPPEYLTHRIKMWDELKAEQDEFYRSKCCLNLCLIPYPRRAHCASLLHAAFEDQPRQEIQVTLPDGSKREGKSWQTTPMDIAKQISSSLAQRIVIAKARLNH